MSEKRTGGGGQGGWSQPQTSHPYTPQYDPNNIQQGYQPTTDTPSAPPLGQNYQPYTAPLYPSVPPAEPSYAPPYANPPAYQETYPPTSPTPLASTVSYGSFSGSNYPPHDYRQHAPSLPQAVRPVLTKTTHRIVHRKEADSHLSCITNVLWFIFGGGIIFAFCYAIVGAILCCTIIGIPFGLQLFKMARLSASAYGRTIERPEENQHGGNLCLNILWLPIGLCLAAMHLLYGCIMFCSLIGIPFALAHWRLMVLALWPFGAELSSYETVHTTVTTHTAVNYESV